jgi:hypothetical protein
MLFSGYGANSYAGIYPDMSMASQIYARDGLSKDAKDIIKSVGEGILSAVAKFGVTELLDSFVGN